MHRVRSFRLFSSSRPSPSSSLVSSHLPSLLSILPSPNSVLTPDSSDGPAEVSPYTTCWLGKYGYSATPSSNVLILRPTSALEVAAVLKYANSNSLPVVPQGGNTGLVGGSVPSSSSAETPSLVLSLSRLNKIHSVSEEEKYIHCQAGCVLHDLQAAASAAGLLFPLSLGSSGSCQIGGNVATNAGGEYYSRYGSVSSNLLGLTAVLPSGEVLDMHTTMRKSSAGFDLSKLFVGSEGTLGVVTDVCFALHPKPAGRALCVIAVESLEAAGKIEKRAREACGGDVAAVELMDWRVLKLVEEELDVVAPFKVVAGEHGAGRFSRRQRGVVLFFFNSRASWFNLPHLQVTLFPLP